MDLLKTERLFNEYNKLDQSFWKRRVHEDKIEFESFQGRFRPFDTRMQNLLKVETPHFNVFEVLNVSHRETKLHTPFLVNLLNPKGSHSQGSLFLDSFLKDLLRYDFMYNDISDFEIHEEHSNEQGQIDILIRFNFNDIPKALVIENKVYAGDQKNQLTRYYDYLTSGLNLSIEDILLVYLTPSAKRPTAFSMDTTLQEELRQTKNLIELGYNNDILPWLIMCNKIVESPRLRETIVQYIKTVGSL